MVNIYDKANEFERALRESDEYKASLAASEELYADEEANALYTEFVSKQKDLMEAAQAGNEPTEEELSVFEEIQQKLLENAKFLEFVQTQQKLQFLIEDLNKIMNFSKNTEINNRNTINPGVRMILIPGFSIYI